MRWHAARHVLATPRQRRCFGWTREDADMHFKVKADGVNFSKLAGGILLRSQQGLGTVLDAMGSRSVSNCLKALSLAGRFAARKRAEAADSRAADAESSVLRFGFVPWFARHGELQWMRLKVVPLSSEPLGAPSSEPSVLRVSARTDLQGLVKAIVAQWSQCCAGRTVKEQDLLALMAMGDQSVSTAVKSAAFALQELPKRGARPFLCCPCLEELPGHTGEPQVVTRLTLEPRPFWVRAPRATNSESIS
eukprot:gnl/TRDRNA2_/TRDRNA2_166372_c0_seq1.p1 gnl/TRDRNA2_/TRDRNA2_166372_c0~~gnl/TRDRNA2_/TRDRNA2_166372_c0_seq1.p1  ORF type:complete len:249 (+),score=38.62 gnl/TRDRNA2_/TRDRNA2_166372_c0_seq1:12-758(+)